MSTRPVLNTALDLLDEAATLLREAACIEDISTDDRGQILSRLQRMAGDLDALLPTRQPETATPA